MSYKKLFVTFLLSNIVLITILVSIGAINPSHSFQRISALFTSSPEIISENNYSELHSTNDGKLLTQSNQGGTWNINNITGTVNLPTGASTLSEQQTQTTLLSNSLEGIPIRPDESSADAFGRIRVSEPTSIFQFSNINYDNIWNQTMISSTVSTGTLTNNTTGGYIVLSIGTTTDSSSIFQSKRYLSYQPSKSQAFYGTGILYGPVINTYKRIGIFDQNNGLFFEQSENSLYVVRRTSTSGTVVDNKIAQSSWNIDKLDGTGISGYTFNSSTTQLFFIDFEYLGVGRIRWGIISGINKYYCHEFSSSQYYWTTC